MHQLPTRSPREYRGKYPTRVCAVAYSRSPAQAFIARFLGIASATHIELNDGRRFIACTTELKTDRPVFGRDLSEITRNPITVIEQLSQERYDEMLEGVRQIRGYRKP